MSLTRSILAALSILALTFQSVGAVSYPSSGPSGSYAGGSFGTYFQNLVTNPCPSGEVVIGFLTGASNYGEPICASMSIAGGATGDTLRYDGTSWVANSIIYNDGTNVGIGNSGPASTLDVRGVLTVNPNAFGDAINLYNGYKIRTVGGGGIQFQGSPFTAIGNTSGLNGATFSVGYTGAAVLTLYPDIGQKGLEISGYNFAVDNAGSLGIGTTTPNAKLEIASTQDNAFRIDKTAGTNWSYMEWLYGGVRKYWQGMNSAGYYALQSDTSTGQIFLSGSRISIGVASPNYRLDVAAGYVNSASGYCIGGSCIQTWSGITTQIIGLAGYLARFNSGGFLDSSSFYETGGKLYIGDIPSILSGSVSKPGYLTIQAPTTTNVNNPFLTLSEMGGQECRMWITGSNKLSSNCSWGSFSTTTSFDPNQIIRSDSLGTGLTGSIIYESGSNIGIGTLTPGAKLEVAGQIKITGGSPGSNKVLTSDSSGLATWQSLSIGAFTGVSSFNGRTGTVIGASGDYTAGQITNVAAGNIAATNVQAALNELDTEKQVVITGAATSVTTQNLLADYALISTSTGKIGTSSTVSSTELGYLDGVTSNIQPQINGKEPTITAGTTSQYWRGDKSWQTLDTSAVAEAGNLYYNNTRVWAALSGAISPYLTGNLTASRALASDTNGKLSVASTTLTELNFVSGVSSSIQTQLNDLSTNKANLASPALTGTPTAPTAATGTNNTQIATTAFVNTAITNGIASGALVGNFWYLSGNALGANDFLGTTNNQNLRFRTNNVERMMLDTNGNLGIGTSTGTAKLEIAGQVRILGGSPSAGKVLTSDATGLATWENSSYPCTVPTLDPDPSWILSDCYGSGALQSNQYGYNNIAIGEASLGDNLDGNDNVGVGFRSLKSNIYGFENVGLGSYSLFSNTNGAMNVGVGSYALTNNNLGASNTSIGPYTMVNNLSGDSNTALGYEALRFNVGGDSNTALGQGSLYYNYSGSYNIGIGYFALGSNANGSGNVAIGKDSLTYATGSNNIGLGLLAGQNLRGGNNNIAIGNNTSFVSINGSNQINIGNIIYASGASGGGGGNLGIGTGALNTIAKLKIAGQIEITGGSPAAGKVLTSDATGLATWQSLSGTSVISVFGRTGAVIGASGDYTAGQITNVAAGNIAATNVQAALNELDTEKEPTVTAGTTAQYYRGDKTFQNLNAAVASALTGAISTTLTGNLTASSALVTDNNGKITTLTGLSVLELGYVDGVTSAIQTQINAKAPLASPALTGVPTAPTPALTDSGTTLATTAFVKSQSYLTGYTETDPQVGTITTNYLSKWDGSALVTSSIFDNGNVGIGTATPGSYKLNVNGNTFIAGDLSLTGKLYVDTIVNRTVTNISVSGGIIPDTAAPQNIRDIGTNTNRWNNLYLSGQITIGGGSPGLNKVLVSDANGLATWVSTGSLFSIPTGWTLSGNALGANDFLGTTNNQNLRFRTNNVERMMLDTNGNLGIGTSTGTAKLEIAGQVRILGGSPSAGKVLTSDATGLATWQSLSGTSVISVFGRTGAVIGASGDYTAGQITNVAAGNIAATNVQAALNELDTEKEPTVTAGTTAQYYRGDKTFQNLNAAVASALTGAISTTLTGNLTASSALVTDNNGKITTLTGLSVLELGYVDGVTSAIQTQINAKAPLASPALTGVPTAPTPALTDSGTTLATTAFVKSQSYLTGYTETDPQVGTITTNYLSKWDGSALVTSSIFDNGNVGIGTATPGSYKLNVNGNTFIAGDLSLTGKLYVDTIVNRTVTNISVSGGIIPDTAAPQNIRDIGTNTNRWNNLYLSGQITIGGGSPGLNKVLVSDANGLATWVSTGSLFSIPTGWTLSGNALGANDFLGTTNNQNLRFRTNNVERMMLDTNGNLGIGTSTGTAKLEIAGQVRILGGSPSAGKVLTSDATGLATWQSLSGTSVISVFGRTGAVIGASGDYTAGQITNVAAGNIAATNVQAALNELDTEKEPTVTAGTTAQYYRGDKTFQNLNAAVASALTGAISTTLTGNLTASSALVTDNNGKITTLTGLSVLELGYVDGVTSAIQTQINAKAPLASPALTGVPTAPTPALTDSGTTLATTAFVKSQSYLTGYTETDPQVGTITTNYLSKWDGSALVTSSIFDNGNVGIGTATPGSYKLNVNGNTFIAGDLSLTGKLYVDTIVNRTVTNISVSGGIIPDTAAPQNIRDIGTNTNRWNNLYLSGQITIGGGSPGLNKVLVSDANGLATWVSTGSLFSIPTGWTLSGNALGANDFLGTTNNQNLRFRTNNVERMMLDTNGNLGIGTSTGTAKLEIAGQVRILGGSPSAGKVLTSDATGLATWQSLSGTSVISVFGRTGAVIGASGDYTAGQITNVAAGNIAATNVQAALNELDTEKEPTVTAGTTAQYYRGDKTFQNLNAAVASALTGAISTTLTGNLTASSALVTDNNGKITTLTGLSVLELGYVDGVTSAIQTQINAKAPLASPALTGVPTAPTPALTDSGTTLATTAFVKSQSYLTGYTETDPQVGTITTNYLSKWDGSALVTSSIFDNGNVGIGTATPGSYKLNVNGNTFIAGDLSLTGKLYVDTIVNRTVTNISVSGGIIPDTAAPLSVRELGTNGTRWNNLYLSGQITIGGGSPGLNKVLVSDANGLATWTATSSLFPNAWSLSGNSVGANDFIGSTNAQDVVMKVNNIERLRMTTSNTDIFLTGSFRIGRGSGSINQNVAFGINSLSLNSTGSYNAAFGVNTLLSNTVGYNNTAIGEAALYSNTTGYQNTALGGGGPLSYNTVGTSNTALGHAALYYNSGSNHVAVGASALRNVVATGGNAPNIAIGYYALYGGSATPKNNTASDNLAIGYLSMQGISGIASTGFENTAVGNNALQDNTTGYYNTAIGKNALRYNSGGTNNVAIGQGALYLNNDGSYNLAIGQSALNSNITGSNNFAIGQQSLQNLYGGSQNTAIGKFALTNLPSGWSNTAVGISAGESMTGGASNNTIIGAYVGTGLTTGSNNILIGYGAQVASGAQSNQLSIGNWIYGSGGNIGIGTGAVGNSLREKFIVAGTGVFNGIRMPTGASAGYVLTADASGNARWAAAGSSNGWSLSGNSIGANDFFGTTNDQNIIIKRNNVRVGYFGTGNNISFGSQALMGITAGTGNIAMGGQALFANTGGSSNIAIGTLAMYANKVGYSNTAIGGSSLYANTSGYNNTAIGFDALKSNINGIHNTAIGMNALKFNVDGQENTGVGAGALRENISGLFNTAVGTTAMRYNISGDYNSALGDGALMYNDGDNNTAVGMNALGAAISVQNNTALGTSAGSGIISGSNNIVIGYNAQVAVSTGSNQLSIGNWIYGNSGSIGISTTTPGAKLDVNGTIKAGTGGTVITNMGVCTTASVSVTNTGALNITCTGVPASTSVAVHCNGSAAFTTPASTSLYCRPTGTVNQVACNTTAANAVAMTYKCMWMQ